MSDQPPRYIADAASLRSLCRQLRDSERIALDTEFVGEGRFVARLELIQVAAGDLCAVVDVPALGTVHDLAEVLGDQRILKVFHAGRQDLELLSAHTGTFPLPFFDTQLAAAMVGYGLQAAYGQLVQKITGKKLDKSHTYTNWSQRPLTQEQINYALEDVQFLFPIHDHLLKRLRSLGRSDWVQEEFARLQSLLSTAARGPHESYRRIRGWEHLKPRAGAVLKELAAWRDEEARRRDVPRSRVVRDEVLLELARRPPTTLETLKGTRGLHATEIERKGEAMLAAIQRGLEAPESEWPMVATARGHEPESSGQVELLQAVLKALAKDEHIAPSLLATASDLQALVDAKHDRDKLDLPILHGWRRKLAGETLLQVLDGNTGVSVDRHTGKLRLTPVPLQ
ncbi:MAG: ribonuclease D [Nitrospiraceae bacterium]